MTASVIPNATLQTALSTGAAASVNTSAETASAGEISVDFMKTLTQMLGTDGSESSDDNNATDADAAAALETDPTAIPDMLIADLAQALGVVAESRSDVGSTSAVGTRALAGAQLQMSQGGAAAAEMLKDVARAAKQGAVDTAIADMNTASDSKVQGDSGDAATADGVNALGMQSNATAQADQRTQLHIHERVGTTAWREEVGAKLNWLIDRGVQSGSLRLTPDNLGPMEVRISVQQDQVSVWFGAAHADTRAALENALPRLREMFAAQGMTLTDAGVFHESPKNSQQGTQQDGARGYADNLSGTTESGIAIIQSRIGLLDAYA